MSYCRASLLIFLATCLTSLVLCGESAPAASEKTTAATVKSAKAASPTRPLAPAAATRSSASKTKAAKPAPVPAVPAPQPAPTGGTPNLDDEVRAEIVPLPPLKKSELGICPKAAVATLPSAFRLCSALRPKEPGYRTVLSGVLDRDLELGAVQSPVLIRGTLVIAEGVSVTLKPGAVLHLKADLAGEKPAQPELPDPTQSGAIWIWGTLQGQGVTGNPVEILNQEKTPAALLLYGASHSRMEGVRLKNLNITQSAGAWLWTNCELVNIGYYALAGGGALFTHCTLKSCGGVFATYTRSPWSLLMRKNVFDGCREGVVLGSNPGDTRLIVEKNDFVRTRGAHIRVMPTEGKAPAAQPKDAERADGKPAATRAPDTELLIGENWYGTNILEDAEARLVDRRFDPSVNIHLNTRPPAEQPYTNIGAGAPSAVIAATLREQQAAMQRILQYHPAVIAPTVPAASAISKGLGGSDSTSKTAAAGGTPVMSRAVKRSSGK